jgi:hypothetical protein
VYQTVPVAYTSLEQAIQGAKDHFRANYFGLVVLPKFRVYQSTDPDGVTYAFVEVTRGEEDMVLLALYKIIAGKYRFVGIPSPTTTTTAPRTEGVVRISGEIPMPEGRTRSKSSIE